jgi:general secretion pathway protein L
MTLWRTIGEIMAHWTDTVAGGIIALAGRFVSPRVVRLVEADRPNTFTLQEAGRVQGSGKADGGRKVAFADGRFDGDALDDAVRGSRLELVLRPGRFLVRPLELPARATEFIEGIVRVQIDRLTPWTAAEAVFGCTAPAAVSPGKIVTTIAATTRANTAPYIAALAALHPASVSIFTPVGAAPADLIKVFEQQARGLLDRQRLSRLLRLALAGIAAVAVLSTAAGSVVGTYLDSRRAELNGELAARRVALRLDGSERSPLAILARHKHESQASVIVIEELSRILPDNTYVTELHIDGNTLQITGVTQDAPPLIGLLEQSRHFSRATFFAPTTRAPSDPGDRFHIEAKLEPVNTVTAGAGP